MYGLFCTNWYTIWSFITVTFAGVAADAAVNPETIASRKCQYVPTPAPLKYRDMIAVFWHKVAVNVNFGL